MESLHAIDIINLILKVVGIAITLGVAKWINEKYKHFKINRDTARQLHNDQIREIFQLIKDVKSELCEQLLIIKKEVMPNGGSSMNDNVTRIANHLNTIDVSIVDIKRVQRNNREIMGLASWESDNIGRVTYVSIALCDLVGHPSSELMDDSWVGFIIPEDRKRVIDEWRESVERASEFNSIYTYKKADGSLQKVKGVAIHNKNSEGKVISSLGRLNATE